MPSSRLQHTKSVSNVPFCLVGEGGEATVGCRCLDKPDKLLRGGHTQLGRLSLNIAHMPILQGMRSSGSPAGQTWHCCSGQEEGPDWVSRAGAGGSENQTNCLRAADLSVSIARICCKAV